MHPSQSSNDVDNDLRQQVLDWSIRRNRADWSEQDEQALQNWLQADIRHAEAYHRWQAGWKALDILPADAIAQLRTGLAREKADMHAQSTHKTISNRSSKYIHHRFLQPLFRPLLAFATLLLLTVSASWFIWPQWHGGPEYSQAFETHRGEQDEIKLPDGSIIQLDTATRIKVAYYADRREIQLADGQAVFSVQANPARPFHVLAGPIRVTVLGTRFAVRHTPSLIDDVGAHVAVESGKVRVTRLNHSNGNNNDESNLQYLQAGQQVTADMQGRLSHVLPLSSDGIAYWRNRRISFVDTRLDRVLAEFQRYGDVSLRIHDPHVAALRLSGTFDPQDPATLQRILPMALPVVLHATDKGTEIRTRQ